jgi:mannosyltransferase OCH1-like enzyme
MIPKILHLCWFGGGEMPDVVKMCIDSWHSVLGDYKIMRWDDASLPVVPYVQNALKHRKLANVANYVRFHALFHYGGIYLDTDIEAVSDFEPVLDNRLFAGWQKNGEINNAVMGAVPQHPLVADALRLMPEKFDGTEKANLSSPSFMTELVFKRLGIDAKSAHKLVVGDDVTVYPDDYFYPFWWEDEFAPENVTPNTLCIHHWLGAWKQKA